MSTRKGALIRTHQIVVAVVEGFVVVRQVEEHLAVGRVCVECVRHAVCPRAPGEAAGQRPRLLDRQIRLGDRADDQTAQARHQAVRTRRTFLGRRGVVSYEASSENENCITEHDA